MIVLMMRMVVVGVSKEVRIYGVFLVKVRWKSNGVMDVMGEEKGCCLFC